MHSGNVINLRSTDLHDECLEEIAWKVAKRRTLWTGQLAAGDHKDYVNGLVIFVAIKSGF